MHALVDPKAPVTAALIEAIGVPAVLLDPQGVIQALSPTAPALVTALAKGKPLAEGAPVFAAALLGLEPPRYCTYCARRMIVQVSPHGWTARCSRHGEFDSSSGER